MRSPSSSCVHPRASRSLRRRSPNAAAGELSGSRSLRFNGYVNSSSKFRKLNTPGLWATLAFPVVIRQGKERGIDMTLAKHRKRYNVAPGRVPDYTRGALPPCTCKRCHNTARTGAS